MLVLTVLPLLAALILLGTLAVSGYTYLRATDSLPFPFNRNLPRKFFGLPPRQLKGPRYELLVLAVPVTIALIAGWVVVGRNLHSSFGSSTGGAVALALAVTPIPASIAAFGLWFVIGDRGHAQRVRRNLATIAMTLLPPLATALVAGLTRSGAGVFVLTTVTAVLAVGISGHAWKNGTGRIFIEDTPPASPFERTGSSADEHTWHAHGSHNLHTNNNSHAAANTGVEHNNSEQQRRGHARINSYLSERSNAETIPEWSFTFDQSVATAARRSQSGHGHYESELDGLSEVEEESEEYHEHLYDPTRPSFGPSDESNIHPRGTSIGRALVGASDVGPTPYGKKHVRNPSTPYATDYSVLASYSPNPFMPLPRGFDSLTTLPGSSHDTLALCNRSRTSGATTFTAEKLSIEAIVEKLSAGPRDRDASGNSTNTFSTGSSGPIQVQLHSFEPSTPSVQLTGHSPYDRVLQPPISPPKQPRGPRPLSARVSPSFDTFVPTGVTPFIAPALPSPSLPSLNVSEFATQGIAAQGHFQPGFPSARSPRRAPLVLALSPIPGTPVPASPSASPVPPSPTTPATPLFVNEHPHNLWLLAVACTLLCFVLSAPLLVTQATTATLATFTVALLIPSPLLTVALFYPRRATQIPSHNHSAPSLTQEKVAELDLSFENIDIEAARQFHDPRRSAKPELTSFFPDDLFPLNMPLYPSKTADRDYPFHAYKLNPPNENRPHTACDGAIPRSGLAAQWVARGHAREGLGPLARAGEMLKRNPALCVMEDLDAEPSTKRDGSQGIIARLRGGIVSMIEKTAPRSDSPPGVTPATPDKAIKTHRPKQSNNSGNQILSDGDTSRDTEVSEGGGIIAQIEVATRGLRSASPSFVVPKDMTVEILTNFGIIPHVAPRDQDTDEDRNTKFRKNPMPAENTIATAHQRSTSVDLPFRPSVDGHQSTPRRRFRAHHRQSSSISTLYGTDQMDFSRPSGAPSIDYAARPLSTATELTRPATIIDMNSSQVIDAQKDCNESIFRSAALARDYLSKDEQEAWNALQGTSTFRRTIRGSRSAPTTPHRRCHGSNSSSPAVRVGGPLTPSDCGSKALSGSSCRGSLASLATQDAAGVEEMEQVMAMDTPARARWVSTPVSSGSSSVRSGSSSRVRLSSGNTVGTEGTTPTERRRFISNASSFTDRTSVATSDAESIAGTLPPLPPLPSHLSHYHHPHPPPIYPNGGAFFASSESLAAVLERSFEGEDDIDHVLGLNSAPEQPKPSGLPPSAGIPNAVVERLSNRPRLSNGAFSIHSDKPEILKATATNRTRRHGSTGSVLTDVGNTSSSNKSPFSSKGRKASRDSKTSKGSKTSKTSSGTKSNHGSSKSSIVGILGKSAKGPKKRSLGPVAFPNKENAPRPTSMFSYSSPWDDVPADNVRTGRGRVIHGLRM